MFPYQSANWRVYTLALTRVKGSVFDNASTYLSAISCPCLSLLKVQTPSCPMNHMPPVEKGGQESSKTSRMQQATSSLVSFCLFVWFGFGFAFWVLFVWFGFVWLGFLTIHRFFFPFLITAVFALHRDACVYIRWRERPHFFCSFCSRLDLTQRKVTTSQVYVADPVALVVLIAS